MLEFLNYTIKDDVKPFEMCWIQVSFKCLSPSTVNIMLKNMIEK
jgi:hypothetical protein